MLVTLFMAKENLPNRLAIMVTHLNRTAAFFHNEKEKRIKQ
jgi:hypothetical protein